MEKFNFLSIAFICVFFIPIITGVLRNFTRERIQHSLSVLLDNTEFLAGIFLSIYLTRKIFFNDRSGIFKTIYNWIPEGIRDMLYGKDVLTYIIVVPVILLLFLIIIRLITNPFYNKILIPLSNRIYSGMNSMNKVFRIMISALVQIPRAVFWVFILGLVLNFYTYYFYSPTLAKLMNESNAYQLLYKNAICPVLNSNIAKQIPVIMNDSFGGNSNTVKDLAGGNIRVIEYFNGVTLDEAIKSNAEIDKTAKKVVGNVKDSKTKAYKIYRWITANIKYDYDKAQKISVGSKGISSGSIVAFETRKGICFDYSSLYVSMCRAVGLKVRIVTGLGYSGVMWGDHAWNQVFSSEENRWINVDTTFGTSANYFDKRDFKVDHRNAEIQGEW